MYHLYVCILPHNDQLGRTYFGQNWYEGAGDSPMANLKNVKGICPFDKFIPKNTNFERFKG